MNTERSGEGTATPSFPFSSAFLPIENCMKAEERINELSRRAWENLFQGHFLTSFALLRLKHQFRNFAQQLAKQRAILDGHDLILDPDAWTHYVFDVTQQDFEDYLHEKIARKNHP